MTSTKGGVCHVSGCQRPAQPEAESGLCRICADRYKRRLEMAAARGESYDMVQFVSTPAPKALGTKSSRQEAPRPPKRPAPSPARGAAAGPRPPDPAASKDGLDERLAAYIVSRTDWSRIDPGVRMKVAVLLVEAAAQ